VHFQKKIAKSLMDGACQSSFVANTTLEAAHAFQQDHNKTLITHLFMKKIGILHGKENTFPEAFVQRVNSKNVKNVYAERTLVDELMQGEPTPYAVMIDRISQDVPFYRAYLKNAALNGTAVLNNPFWWSADEKFFNNCLSTKVGVPVPKTILLPSKEMPPDTSGQSFRNLKYPLEWERMIEYLGGFPLFMKPHSGGGWKNVYKVHNYDEFFTAYNETGTLVMLLQEAIDFDSYFRCYCLGGKYVRIMDYEPRNPHHLRYVADHKVSKAKKDEMHEFVLRLNHALGYDFNTVEFALRDGVPYAIDFCNPAPDADLHSVGEENFEWVVENAANMTIEKALAHKEGGNNLTWGTYVRDSAAGKMPSVPSTDDAEKPKKGTGKASKAKK
jgi:glutathione synthase/RimK-type ligase-like ATP-grasp enzyme